MKLLIYVFSAISLSYPVWQRSAAQYLKDPTIFFKNITFDSTLRGSYNISDCVKNYMNCWELVKPDLICSKNYDFDSACAVMRYFCEDVEGEQELTNQFRITESWCNYYETYT